MSDGVAYRDDWKRVHGLLRGELPDIEAEAVRVLGWQAAEAWMAGPNYRLAGQTPRQAVAAGDEGWVRDILRSFMTGGGS